MRRIDQPELEFMILRGLQMIPMSTLKGMASGGGLRSRSLDHAVRVIHERLSHLEYEAPDPLAPPQGWKQKP